MRFSSSLAYTASFCALAGQVVFAEIPLDLTSEDSIKKAAKQLAADTVAYYTGDKPGDVPGNLPQPYYWWEAGAMFGTLINYWYYTGDTAYNAITTQAMLHQAGVDADYMPANQTKTEGNDDQGFWGMAAMTAAELKFPDPPDGSPGWLALAQGVFNTQAARWDAANCNGGLRWQIFTFNNGYNYKNSISNGCFFNLAARLALYTGNSTYSDWAIKSYEWMASDGLISPKYEVYDGTQIADNCTAKDKNTWTYNSGVFLLGSAAMYNHTNGSAIWEERTMGFVNASSVFFLDGVAYEGCEPVNKCNVDQRSFKGYLLRWMAATTQLAPFTKITLMDRIKTSAAAAIKTCTAGGGNTQCGLKWSTGTNDGSLGVGEQMNVLEAVQSNLVGTARKWVSEVAGTGTSKGNNNAGTDGNHDETKLAGLGAVTTGDKAGAGFLTALMLVGVIGGSATMIIA